MGSMKAIPSSLADVRPGARRADRGRGRACPARWLLLALLLGLGAGHPLPARAEGAPRPPAVRDLVSNGDFAAGMSGWEITGQVRTASNSTGGGMLAIHAAKISPNYQVRQSVSLTGGRLYRLSFVYRGCGLQSEGAMGNAVDVELLRTNPTGRAITALMAFPEGDPLMEYVAYYSPPQDFTAWLTITYAWVKGEFDIGNIRLEEVDTAAATDTVWPWQVYPTIAEPVGGRINYAVPWRYSGFSWPLAAGSAAVGEPVGQAGGGPFTAFVPDIDALSELSAAVGPLPATVQRTALKGERVQLCVALRANQALTGVKARLTPGDSWGFGAPDADTVRLVRWMARRGVEERNGTYSVVPELLDSQPVTGEGVGRQLVGVPVAAARNLALWVTVGVPAEAAEGAHAATLQIQADQGSADVPVQIRVGPVALAEPTDMTTALLVDSPRWLKPWTTDEAAERAAIQTELVDFWEHGIRSIVIGGFGRQLGTPVVEGGMVTGFQVHPALVFAAEAWAGLTEAKLQGATWRPQPSVIVDWSNPLGDILMAANGFTPGDAANYDRQLAEIDAQGGALRQQLQTVISRLQDAMKPVGSWALYPTDEPGGSKYKVARWVMQIVRQSGVPTFSTTTGTVVRDLLEGRLDRSLLSVAAHVNARDERGRVAGIREASHRSSVGFWHYGHAGMYTLEGGNMFRNRFNAGVLMEKVQAEGQMIWPFQRPFGDAFNDFDATGPQWWNTGRDWCLAYPRNAQYAKSYQDRWGSPPPPGKGNVSALQWEGLREAWTDRAYLETARQHRDARVEQLLEPIPYGRQAVYGPGGVTNISLGEMRHAIWKALGGRE